jgi:DNA-binding CsgD family transcriptional regulator
VLVGRGSELEVLRELLAASRPVVLVGPAGIGKSTLARVALGEIGAFREGGALATLAWSPFLVFRRILRERPGELPSDVAGAIVNEASSPVLLDDLQWADDASLDAVALLVSQVQVVATVRSGEPRSDEVVAALELVGAARVDLGGLAEAPSAELAELLHPDLAPAERAQLVATADGNPLLLGELPKGPDAAPSLVSALVARLATLPPPGQTAMARLAVLGRPASAAELGPGADLLVPAGLARALEDRFEVCHSLLGEVIVDDLGSQADAVRRDLVPLVDAPESAHLLAVLGDREAARRVALEAAGTERDRRRRATLLELAIRCAPDPDVVTRIEAARLFTAISEPAKARALCDIADRGELDPVLRGALLAVEAEAAWLEGHQEEMADLIERALIDLRGTGTAYEAAALAGSTVVATFVDLDGRPALERAREAVRLADRLGREQGYARTRLASVLLTAGQPGWAELYAEVVERAATEGDDHLRRTAVISLVLGRWISGDAALAEEVARTELLVGPGDHFDEHWLAVASYAALLGLLAGRRRGEIIDEFRPLLDRWPRFRSRPFLESAVILALADAGRHPEVGALAAETVVRAGPEAQWRSIAGWAVVEAAWLAGHPADAVAATRDLLALGVGDYPAAVQARLVGAHAAGELGMDPVGPRPAALLPAWRAAPLEWDAITAASAGRPDDAVRAFVEAADLWVGSDVRSEVRCRWAAGAVAAGAGRPDAIELLERAEEQAATLGWASMLVRVRRSLRSVGVRRQARRAPGVAGLTGREEDALELVEAGLRTTDIAAALGVEASTVESFVRAAMQKLGTPTRTAAAIRWRELQGAEAQGAEVPGP